MFKKLKMSSRRMAIYGLIMILGLPLSLFLGSIKPAQAAEKPKAVIAQKTSGSEPAKMSMPPKMAFEGLPSGLHRSNTYVTGQSISMNVSISGEPSSVWAEIGVLDSNFPEIIYLQNQGEGNWFLKTPKLSSDLNIGNYTIKLLAQDVSGKTIQMPIKIVLKPFSAVTILSYKVTGDGTASIDWQPVSWADVYLVSYELQGNNSSLKSFTTKLDSAKIVGLEPGSLYEVKVQPLRGDAVGPVAKVVFQTLGNAPVKLVEASAIAVPPQEVKKITPSIDREAAATKKVTQATPATPPATPSPTISPSAGPSPTPTPSEIPETTTGGWSKLLIALSILVIAAGAAIGGYYGYEWLMFKSKDKEPPESSNRW